MAWVTYEDNRIIHLPSQRELNMGSYKIGYNRDDENKDHGFRLPRYNDEEVRIYDLENEDDRHSLAGVYIEHLKERSHRTVNILVAWSRGARKVERIDGFETFVERYGEHGERLYEKYRKEYGKRYCLVNVSCSSKTKFLFSNIADYFTIELFGRGLGEHGGWGRQLLFITTDKAAWEEAVAKLKSDLGAVPLHSFNGKPSTLDRNFSCEPHEMKVLQLENGDWSLV